MLTEEDIKLQDAICEEGLKKERLKKAQDFIYKNCTKSDAYTPSVSVTLFEKTVAELLARIEKLEDERALYYKAGDFVTKNKKGNK